LVGSKENTAIGAAVGEEVGAGGRAQSSEVGGWESFEVGSSDNRSSRRRGARSGEKSTIGIRSGGRSKGKARSRGWKGLRESEPKVDRVTNEQNPGVDGGWMDCGAESEVANASWASRRVGSDSGSDRVAFGVAKPKPNEVVNEKESGADRRADSGGFQSGIVGKC
jgi:hypothetical protein